MTNPTYLGRIRHKALDYPGQHPAIIDQALWDSVQAKLLSAHARPRGRDADHEPPRCLTGKLRDETGDVLTPTHTNRRGRRYSYYISHRLIRDGIDSTAWRLPAPEIEAALRSVVAAHLRDAAERHVILHNPDASDAATIGKAVAVLCKRIAREPDLIGSLVETVSLQRDRLRVTLNPAATAMALSVSLDDLSLALTTFDHPITLRRRGVETRIIAGDFQPAPDPVLIRVMAEAKVWAKALRSGTSLTDLAKTIGCSEPYLRARLPLAFLSPSLQTAFLDGRQPPDLSVAKLISMEIPLDWDAQAKLFA